jgi:hypothetical protein
MSFYWRKQCFEYVFILIQGFDVFFLSKPTIYLSLGLQKGRPNYRRSLQLSKENILHFKT